MVRVEPRPSASKAHALTTELSGPFGVNTLVIIIIIIIIVIVVIVIITIIIIIVMIIIPWLRTNGVKTKGAAEKVMVFDRTGKHKK